MSENINEPKTKAYLNYIEGSRLKKYEFNLKDPMDIKRYNQALKLDEDKRNTYLLLLAKKKLNEIKELSNTETNSIIYHPQKLVDKRYDLTHNVYVQEEQKEELEEIRKNKNRLAKERMSATEDRKKEIDAEMEDLETKEKIIEKNLEEEFDEDYKIPSSKSTPKNQNSEVGRDIYKLLKKIDEKYGSKLTDIAKRLENAENTKVIVDEMKEEVKKLKIDLVENDKIIVAETLSVIEEKAKQNNLKKLFDAKIKSSPENIKKLARTKYSQLSNANKRLFVHALLENPTKEDDITAALEKTTKGDFSSLYTILYNTPFTKPMIPLFQRYWNQINKTQLIPEVIKYFSVENRYKILEGKWKNFIRNETDQKTLQTTTKNVTLNWKYVEKEKTLYIISGFAHKNFKTLKTQFTKINDAITAIKDEYIKAYGSDEFEFVIHHKAIYPKNSEEYSGVNGFKAWDEIVKENDFEIEIEKTKPNPGFVIGLSCNYAGTTAIFMNGVSLNAKGFTFIPTVLPITILGKKIDINNPITSLDDLPLRPATEIVEEVIEEESEEEAIPIEPKEEENPSQMEEADGLGSIKDGDELIKSELQTIKSLLFTIIYKMNKKDKDKYNKKNNKSGSIDWLFN